MTPVFDPILSPLVGAAPAWAAVGCVALAGLVALAFGLWRRRAGVWLRGLALALIALALAGPGLQQAQRRGLEDIVLLVDDQSASQSLGERRAQVDAARDKVEAALAARPGTEIRRITVGDDPTGTLLGKTLRDALAAEPAERLAGAIILSDGLAHDTEMIPSDAPAPVHLLLSGQPEDWDRRIELLNAPRFALIGEPAMIRLRVVQDGAVPEAARGTLTLRARLDGTEIATIALRPGEVTDLPVTLESAGANVVTLSVDEAPTELSAANNTAALNINAVRDRLRVLLVSGQPNPGERTWRNLLKSDANIDLIHFTILRPPEKFDGVPVDELALISFPTHELFMERLDDFDLVIFDRYQMRGILLPEYWDNLRRYVDEGGAVLVSAGPEFAGVDSLARSPLGPILPGLPTGRVIEEAFTPKLTDNGRRHPVTAGLEGAEGPDWGRWLRMVETTPDPESVVAMSGPDNQPLLMLRRIGQGRVALIGSDQLWLWGRGFDGGGPQLELMRRVAHWSMKEPELEAEALELTSAGPMAVTVTRRSLGDAPGPVQITAPDGSEATLELRQTAPGRFSGRFAARQPGLHIVRQGDLVRAIAVGPAAPVELARSVADPADLAGLTEASGGSVQRLSDGVPELRDVAPGRAAEGRGVSGRWIGMVRREASTVTGLSRGPLLPGWAWLALIAALMMAAWRAEGRRG